MPYTMEDFRRDYRKELLEEMTPKERTEGLTLEQLLEGRSEEEIEQFLQNWMAARSPRPRKPRRKK
jgi:hypothetical protein